MSTHRALLHIPELTDSILKHLPLPTAISARGIRLARSNLRLYREIRALFAEPSPIAQVLTLGHSLLDRVLNPLPLRTALRLLRVCESWHAVIMARLALAWDAAVDDAWEAFGEGALEVPLVL
ncbi:uncharacterized protein BDZ99DRAFT_527482 [Mytilinidion resinicola]|uniref:F-box domain-containing protein n=1 Tax=Mytilinidion resinicola TaxID=574789 RepID=A0A6A6Y1R2_9PEZI|nr:uncharacterized protein BDZ99DRAFT_527482 [Mytilinidion resinicola]KAF2802453.1 hypothetical protein BDZ99DRAFT_527482 [Mytilinidion resinicola]